MFQEIKNPYQTGFLIEKIKNYLPFSVALDVKLKIFSLQEGAGGMHGESKMLAKKINRGFANPFPQNCFAKPSPLSEFRIRILLEKTNFKFGLASLSQNRGRSSPVRTFLISLLYHFDGL